MSQYQPNAAPNRSFIERINSKFSNLSVSGSFITPEHDGLTEDLTLVHKAFVAFFDKNNEPYPDWLGVKNSASSRQQNIEHFGDSRSHNSRGMADYLDSKYQPVRASYNSNRARMAGNDGDEVSRTTSLPMSGTGQTYTRRANSRLQEMYQKSRLQSTVDSNVPGGSARPTTSRSQSTSQMRRDRVLNGGMSSSGEPRPTWGR